jgi:hypothetical protein
MQLTASVGAPSSWERIRSTNSFFLPETQRPRNRRYCFIAATVILWMPNFALSYSASSLVSLYCCCRACANGSKTFSCVQWSFARLNSPNRHTSFSVLPLQDRHEHGMMAVQILRLLGSACCSSLLATKWRACVPSMACVFRTFWRSVKTIFRY